MVHSIQLLLPSFGRLLLALFFGSLIGWQRQMHGSAAGLRTHILVCLAANLLTCVDLLNPSFQGKLPAAVITGVGFLGAGTILRSDKGDSVHGLTTAASVWSTAGIGIALGSAGIAPYLGAFAAVLVLTTLSVVFSLEEYALRKTRLRDLTICISTPSGTLSEETVNGVIAIIKDMGVAIEATRQVREPDQKQVNLHLKLHLPDAFLPDRLLTRTTSVEGVVQANWDL